MKKIIKKILPKGLYNFTKEIYLILRSTQRSLRYRGNAVMCPCCGRKFRTFLDSPFLEGGGGNRFRWTNYKNVVCPYCNVVPRHRIVCHYLNEHKNILGNSPKILMVAAERPIKQWFRKNGYKYTTTDLLDTSADVQADIQNTPFADESWTLITCNHVLEHVPDYKAALKEMRRILTKDGILEITAPTDYDFTTVYEDTSIVMEIERIKHFG
jgi:SAM-dependent methyltransferase